MYVVVFLDTMIWDTVHWVMFLAIMVFIVVNRDIDLVLSCYSFRCKSCNHVMTTEDVEDWMYHQLENTSHLLHGVIHANGYGHLLRVNGREGGSRVLSGRHIMNFWDRICGMLGVRFGYPPFAILY